MAGSVREEYEKLDRKSREMVVKDSISIDADKTSYRVVSAGLRFGKRSFLGYGIGFH